MFGLHHIGCFGRRFPRLWRVLDRCIQGRRSRRNKSNFASIVCIPRISSWHVSLHSKVRRQGLDRGLMNYVLVNYIHHVLEVNRYSVYPPLFGRGGILGAAWG